MTLAFAEQAQASIGRPELQKSGAAATQAGTRPPTFVLFTTGFLEAGYRRFLERRLREEFGFDGSPVRISVRVREKKERKK